MNLVLENKEKQIKSKFFEKFRSRLNIENLMRKYVKGYSKNKIREKKLNDYYQNQINSTSNNFSDSKSLNSSNYKIQKNSNFLNNKSINDTFNSLEFSTKYNNSKKFYDNDTPKNEREYNKDYSNLYERLNNNTSNTRIRKSTIDIIPSNELKEMKELEECTFRPKINLYYPTLNNKRQYNFTESESFDNQNFSKNHKI
jgi:hypothetical protein